MRVADVSAWVLLMLIVKRVVPPALMLLTANDFEIVGLDEVIVSISAAVQVPAAQEGDELVLVTLVGGEMTAVLVTCVCACAVDNKNRQASAASHARRQAHSMGRNKSIKERNALKNRK